MLNARLFKFWHDLPEALRTGKPQNEVKHGQKGMFEELYAELPRLEQFMGAMTGLSRINFEAFAEKFDFSRYKTLCDVGGATGLLCDRGREAASAPALHHVRSAAGRADRAKGTSPPPASAIASAPPSGDFFKDPLPKADVITMGMILHDWNLEKKMHLIRAAYDALPPGGAFVAIEALIDDARRENAFGLLMSLNMLIEFGDAFDYSGADFRALVQRGGLQALRGHPSRRPLERGGRLQIGDRCRRCADRRQIPGRTYTLPICEVRPDHLLCLCRLSPYPLSGKQSRAVRAGPDRSRFGRFDVDRPDADEMAVQFPACPYSGRCA